MEVTTATGTTRGAGAAASTANASAAVIDSDFDTFLKMLTVQMQNQDPLNPIESSDYAVQLATFSGVEQQVRTNELLASLSERLGPGMVDLAGWVGREARAPAPALFDGSPITVVPAPDPAADAAEMIVRRADGTEVQRLTIPVSNEPVDWAGVSSDGAPLPSGVFTFEVVSYSGEEVLGTTLAETYSRVTEVRMEAGATVLVLASGATVPSTSVTAIREP